MTPESELKLERRPLTYADLYALWCAQMKPQAGAFQTDMNIEMPEAFTRHGAWVE